jgi:phosphate transport system substrate-binding protein
MQSKIKLTLVFFTVILVFALTLAAWGQETSSKAGTTSAKPIQELQGTIRVSGAWALYPMMVGWGEEFRKIYPKVRIDISAGGAGKGAADALSGLVDIGMVSREINPEEVRQGAFYVPVVKDAVFPTLNEGNPVLSKGLAQKGVKKKTFVDLWIHGKDLTWGEVAGMTSKDKVRVYTRSDSCGAAETWAQYLERKKQEDLQGVGVYGDPGLAEAVRKDIFGIGYNNLNYAYDFKTGLPPKGLSIIPIDVNENGRVDPEEDLRTKTKAIQAVSSGHYPSPPARDLYLITKDGFKGVTKSFVLWILTDGQKYVDENGYIKLIKTQMDQSLRKLGN